MSELEFIHDYLERAIVLADRKAGTLVGVAIALLLFIFERDLVSRFHVSWFAIGGLVAVLCCGLAVLAPRGGQGDRPNLIYWDGIQDCHSVECYEAFWMNSDSETWLRQLAQQVFILSDILQKKYFFVAAAFAALAWALVMLLSIYFSQLLT